MHAVTAKDMIVCELGGFASHIHFPAEDVRMALGPDIRAVGSEGGQGYGWGKRRLSLPAKWPAQGVWAASASAEPPPTAVVGENAPSRGVFGQRPIGEYREPSEEHDGANGTQDSTARSIFPKVSTTFPEYMRLGGGMHEGDAEGVIQAEGAISSGDEWMPEFEDVVDSSGDEGGDYVPRRPLVSSDFEEWCHSTASFKPVRLDMEQLRAFYCAESWNSDRVSLLGSRDNFCGPPPGFRLPPKSALPKPEDVFELYWTEETLARIVLETNRYARELKGGTGDSRTRGGLKWHDVCVAELRAWLGICILMGVKRLPCVRHYWMRSEGFIYCSLISSVMTLARWEDILRCLHLVNNEELVRDVASRHFDRIAKTRWVIDMFVTVSKEIYNLEREITVDECVIPYKGKYCFIRQFMPDKPIRFGIKCWLLASSKSRFVSNIEVYFGEGTGLGPHGLGYHVVLRMIAGLEQRWHCLVVDNLFASVNLFHELMVLGMWATGTVRKTSKNLPDGLYRESDNAVRGSMVIKVHDHRQMAVVSWQDKCLVTLLSTAANPWEPGVVVLRKLKGMRGQLVVPSSPIHTQYQEYMRGVDVSDQIRANYSSQLKSHKWWHKLFFFIVDQSMVNSYVVYCSQMEQLGLRVRTHMQFKIAVGKYLVSEWMQARSRPAQRPPPRRRRAPPVHCLWQSDLRRRCVQCGHVGRWHCPACGDVWMCPQNCYHAVHSRLR